MKQKIFLIAVLILNTFCSYSQTGIKNQGGTLKVDEGALLKLMGTGANYTNLEGGTIDLEGTIDLDGDWTNSSSTDLVFINRNGKGTVRFTGTAMQTIGGGYQTFFENLYLNNTSGITLGAFVEVDSILTLTSTILDLTSNDLKIGTIGNLNGSFNVSNMIVSSSGGFFRFRPVVGTYNILPLGDNSGTNEYSRLYIYPNVGTIIGNNAEYAVRAANAKHPQNTSTPDYLNRYWQIQSSDITNQNARIYAYYNQADAIGTETNLVAGQYINPFWKQGAFFSAASNYMYFDNVTQMGDFTAGQATTFNISIAITNETVITEGAEDGDSILVSLTNGSFVTNLNLANWTVYNLPQGVTIGTVKYIDDENARLYLSGNRTKDFDSDLIDIEVVVNANEVNNLNSGTISANSGVTIANIPDAESLSMTFDGTITEGSENGETIYVNLSGGTFADPIVPSNWVLSNLPAGVEYTILRVNETQCAITLTSNTNEDYDSDITNFSVVVHESEIDDHAGSDLSVSTGVIFTAVVEAFTITMGMVSAPINEAAENGEVIWIKISGDTFVGSLNNGNWVVNNLPQGVTWNPAINRIADDSVQITLSGNRTKDYDANITNVSVSINADEITTYSSNIIVSSGIVLTATNDAEILTLSSGVINEGSENGTSIVVSLAGGTFNTILDKTKWSVSNLPEGVTIGSVTYNNANQATILLSGNASKDYDSDIDFNLSVDKTQLFDVSAAVSGAGQISFIADNDPESIILSGTIVEGSEDGAEITIDLAGGTFNTTVTLAQLSVSNLPDGVEPGTVTVESSTQIKLGLLGNATTDYDSDIEDATILVDASAFSASDGNLSAATGVLFDAIDEPATISLSSPAIYEGSEDGSILSLTLNEDVFAATMNAGNCLIYNLPDGVAVSNISRESDMLLELTLSGNRLVDFDTDISNIYVEITDAGLVQHNYTIKSDSISIVASNDVEILTLVSGTIPEQSEDGAQVLVALQGGTFAQSLNILNWHLTNAPAGVTIGALTPVSADTVQITLSNNASNDYDSDIDLELTIDANQIDDYDGANIVLLGGVTFEAYLEPIGLTISNNGPITEGSENGGEIIVTVTNDIYVTEINRSEWEVSYLPSGVFVDTLIRQDDTHVLIVLAGNSTTDFDTHIDTVQVMVKGSQFLVQQVDFILNSGVLIQAINDDESIDFLSTEIMERAEDNAAISLELAGGTFAEILAVAEWNINGQPSGVSLSHLERVSSTLVNLVLLGNADTDYDTDLTNFSVTVNASQINDHNELDGSLLASSGVTFKAINEQLTYNIPLGTLSESNINESEIELSLVGDAFVDFGLDVANFSINNAPPGVAIGAVEYIDETNASLMLTYDRTDFDIDYTNVSITVNAAEILSGTNLTTVDFTISAEIELPYIFLSDNGIYEGEENLGFITVSLFEDTFKTVLDLNNWFVANLPLGVSVKELIRVDAVTVNILLQGSRASDYDQDLSNVAVTISALELVDGVMDVSASSGVVFIAVNDEESLMFTPIEIFEGNENGVSLTLNLSGGTFASTINPGNWSFSNLPAGITAANITKTDAVTVTLDLNGNATTDYDSDISNFSITIPASDVDDMQSGNLIANQGVVFVSRNEQLKVNTLELTEETLNGASLSYALIDENFEDTDLAQASFVLLNAPVSLSINSVTYINDTAFSVTLAYDGTDFDSNYEIALQISANELSGISDLTSDGTLILATDDDELIALSTDVDGIYEGSEINEIITVTLAGGTFNAPLNTAGWTLLNLPIGVTYSISHVSNQEVQIKLLSNSTEDYDIDIYNFAVEIPATDISDYEGLGFFVSGNVVFNAYNEQLSVDGTLTEMSLNGATLTLVLTDDEFADATLDVSNFVLHNYPFGLSIQDVSYISNTEAQLTLNFSQVDFDTDITNFYVSIAADELRSLSTLTSNYLTISATIELEDIEISHAGLTEANLVGAVIALKTKQVKFTDNLLDKANFTINNGPLGCSISSISYLTDTTAQLSISFDNTDFDTDKLLSVTVSAVELTIGSSITSNEIPVIANNDIEIISLANDGEITEGTEDGEVLQVKLTGGNFAANLDFAAWELLNLPYGVEASNYSRVNDSLVTLELSGNRKNDFDADLRINVSVPSGDIFDSEELITSTYGFDIIAINDPEIITMADDGEIREGAEDGETITLTIQGGNFSSEAKSDGFVFTNLPAGIQIGSFVYDSPSQITITLSGNASVDYDEDILANLEIQAYNIYDYSEGIYLVNQGVVFKGSYELNDRELNLLADALSESNLDGYVMNLSLNHDSFTDAVLDVSSFTLYNAPAGLSIASVSYINEVSANITFAFDGTDFDTDITNFFIECNGIELSSTIGLESHFVTIAAVDEIPALAITHLGLNELNLNGAELTLELSFDTFSDAQVSLAEITLNNAPSGLTVNNFTYINSTLAVLTLAFDQTDFDVDYLNFSVTIDAVELSSGLSLTSNELTIVAANEDGSLIASVGQVLTEANLNGSSITLQLVGQVFADNNLDNTLFALHNVPKGVSVSQVNYLADNKAELVLGFSGNDFDSDFKTVAVQIDASELSGVDSLVSNTLQIKANDDDESLFIQMPSDIVEGHENGSTFQVTIQGGTFVSDPDKIFWNFTAIPSGVSIDTIEIVALTQAQITLKGNAKDDFDSDLPFTLKIGESQFDDYSGVILETSNIGLFKALVEVPEVVLSASNLSENTLNGQEINIELKEMQFKTSVIKPSDFELVDFPQGISIASVTYLSANTARLVLSFDTVDFDTDQMLSVKLLSNILTVDSSVVSNALAITAINDDELFTLAFDGEITERAEDGEKIELMLQGGTFAPALNFPDWSFANLPGGVIVGSINRVNDTLVWLFLSGNSTVDYDTNLTQFTVHIPMGDFFDSDGTNATVTGGVVFTAIDENVILSISHAGLTEQNLNGAIIDVKIQNAVFVDGTQNLSYLTLNFAPEGTVPASFIIANDSTANLQLHFDGTDFDADISNFSISIDKELLSVNEMAISNTLTISAFIEPEAIVDYDGEILEGYENGETIEISLITGKFEATVSLDSIYFDNLPEGISITNLNSISDTLIQIQLLNNRIVDYDTDISNVVCTIEDGVLQGYTGLPVTCVTPLVFKSFDESLTISSDALNEGTLNGAVIELSLSDEVFVNNTINLSNITLYNAPSGVWTDSIYLIDATHANLVLAYDGTDFTQDIQTFYVGISPNELHGVAELTSNMLTIYEGVSILDKNNTSVKIFTKFANVFIETDILHNKWDKATVLIFDVNGKSIYNSALQRVKINTIKLDVETGFYFVKVSIDGTEFVNKVFILPE